MNYKEIERAAQKHADELQVSTAIPGALVPMLHDIAMSSYIRGAKYALENQWRPFSAENAPYVGQEVLIMGETGDIILAKIIEQRIGHLGAIKVWHPEVKCKVTYWATIPQFNPKKKKDENQDI